MAATIKDVAKETGLAISTISKYMNGGMVRPKNKKIIDEAVKKLGYSPNSLARGLRSARTYTVGVLISNMEGAYGAKLVHYLEQNLQMMGYALILCCHKDSPEMAEEYVDFLCEQMVDGIIVTNFVTSVDYLKQARERQIPLVAVEALNAYMDMDLVQVDSATSSYELVEHLIRQGHRDIGVIKGPADWKSAQERLKGFYRVMEDYELPVKEEFLVDGDFEQESGYAGIEKLWSLEKRPTAVFITNYYMCMGAVRAIEDLKIQVPEELSVVSFDEHTLSRWFRPGLTTVEQPLEEMAREACIILKKRIEEKKPLESERIRLKARVHYRDSVKKISRN